jgi:hypothetical protein
MGRMTPTLESKMKFETLFRKPVTIEALAEREMVLEQKLAAAHAELEAAEHQAAESYIGDDDAAPDVDAVLRRQAAVSAINGAIVALRRQRPSVIEATSQRDAATVRAAAEGKRKELEAMTRKREKLLGELGELEGVAGLFVADRPTRSEALSGELVELERRADALETQIAPASGLFDTEDTLVISSAEVILAVLKSPSIGPTAREIQQWMRAVELAALPRAGGQILEEQPRRVRIVWTAGSINAAESYIFWPGIAPPMMSMDGSARVIGIHVGGGTFQSERAA